MSERGCWNCRHATWQKTANGRRNPGRHGECKHPVAVDIGNGDHKSTLPASVHNLGLLYTAVIWRTSGDECPTWEGK